ncbi:cytochrome-c oxidase, cbb3-type subunit I [Myxococcota bacterium]|nr:cytochrome-c oxidase, cbb3-type subunit I [Myxococcota bacterium]MBU1898937.1 cytochrome-c oxidase, cbb3-type subunit I [Myxococcota bacterium]
MNVDTFRYDDKIVRKFALATIFWAVFSMTIGVWIALQLAARWFNFDVPEVTFGRLRPLHTNAAIFAFVGNSIFGGIYYSIQRLLKARIFSDLLSNLHFWLWNIGVLVGGISFLLGYTQGKEYAELEWPLDIAVTLVWVIFAVNFFGTIFKRRVRHLYVAIWFYISAVVAVAMLYIVNNLSLPVSLTKSYSIFAGVQDALVQWWYGHNAVAFFLTTPVLGLMYYFVPKAAERPVYSYRLSIVHFWSLVFIYIWAGPHHLLYTALPEWAQTLGTVFSLMLIAPSWGGMINGLLTLRGAWDKLRTEPVLKFLVTAVTFYGMSTFEGPMMSTKTVNSLSHYTNWTVGHVHSGTLGWNGFMAFGILYWLVPRLWQTPLFSKKMATAHFWIGLIGIGFYVMSMWAAGIGEGLMWKEFTPEGALVYYNWTDTLPTLEPMYWVRATGGLLYLTGATMMLYNLTRTIMAGTPSPDPEVTAAPLEKKQIGFSEGIHGFLESKSALFTILTFIALAIGGAVEIIPTLLIRSNVPTIDAVKPLTALELEGRDIYVAEGCYNCHSQMIRPFRSEVARFGEYSKPGESVYNHPFQFGSRRIGPDLAREGVLRPDIVWHYNHMMNPESTSPGSIMPNYPWLFEEALDLSQTRRKLGIFQKYFKVPYSPQEVEEAEASAKQQAAKIADFLLKKDADANDLQAKALIAQAKQQIEDRKAFIAKEGKILTAAEQTALDKEFAALMQAAEAQSAEALAQKNFKDIRDKKIVALIAYLLRLGTDIQGAK